MIACRLLQAVHHYSELLFNERWTLVTPLNPGLRVLLPEIVSVLATFIVIPLGDLHLIEGIVYLSGSCLYLKKNTSSFPEKANADRSFPCALEIPS